MSRKTFQILLQGTIILMTSFYHTHATCPDFYAAPTSTWTLDASSALSANCSLCPARTPFPNITTTPTPHPPTCACPPGTHLNTTTTPCLPCPPSHICAGGRAPPTPCPPHRTPNPTATACHCTTHLFDHPTDPTACLACPATHYCPGHGLPAQPCPLNQHIPHPPGSDLRNCTCVPGTTYNDTNAACAPCPPGIICPGHDAPTTTCPAHGTSPPRSTTSTACVCLPPFTRSTATACEQLPTRAAALYLSDDDLAQLSGGAGVTVLPGHGCTSPSGACSAHLDVHVHSPSRLTLLAHNLVIEPAYLGLLFAVLEGADVTAMHYTTTRTRFSTLEPSDTPAWKCTANLHTQAAFLQDPAAQHTAAMQTLWDAVLRADAALAGQAWVRTDAVRVDIGTATTAVNASDFARCGFGPVTVDYTTPGIITLHGAPCPTDAALACALASHGGTVQSLACHSQQILVVAGPHHAPTSLPPEFSCTSGYVEQTWNHTTLPHAAESFAREAWHDPNALVFGPHLLGRIDVTLADHAHTEDLAFANANRSRWVTRTSPAPVATRTARWFAALHVPPPIFLPEQHSAVHVSLVNSSTPPRVRLDLQGLLLARHDSLGLLRALHRLADRAPPRTIFIPDPVVLGLLPGEVVLNASVQDNRLTVAWSANAQQNASTIVAPNATHLEFGNGSSALPVHSVLRFRNQTWRPLGHLAETVTAGVGALHVLGTASAVRAALLDLQPGDTPRANVTLVLPGGANATCGGHSTFTVHTVLEAVVEPLFLTRMVQQVLLRLLLAPAWGEQSRATLASHPADRNTTTLHVVTAVPTAAACSRSTIRNPAFTDVDLTAALAALVPLPPGHAVELTSHCRHACTSLAELSAEHATLTDPAEASIAWSPTTVHPDRLASTLDHYDDTVFPHLTIAQTFVLDTPDAAAIVAAAEAVQFGDAVRLPNLRAAAGGLAIAERAPHMGWGGVVYAPTEPGCLRVRTRNEAIHVQDLIQVLREAHAVEAPVRVTSESVHAEFAAAPGTVGEDHAQILALQRAGLQIAVGDVEALHLSRATMTWPDARYAPNVSDVLEIGQRAALAALEVEAVHVHATVWLRVGAMSLTLAQLEMLRGDIEVALDDALGSLGNAVLGFDTSPAAQGTDFEFAMHTRLRAKPDCQHVPKALYQALHAEDSWLRTWGVTAKVAATECRVQLAATGWDTESVAGIWETLRGRAICAWNVCNVTVHDTGGSLVELAQRVNVTAPDVAGFVTAVDVVLGPSPRARLAVALAEFSHDVTVCGVEDKAVQALTPYFGEFYLYCKVFL